MALIGTYKAIYNKLGVHKKIKLWAQNYNAYHRQTHKQTHKPTNHTSQLMTNCDLIPAGEHNTTNKPIMLGRKCPYTSRQYTHKPNKPFLSPEKVRTLLCNQPLYMYTVSLMSSEPN